MARRLLDLGSWHLPQALLSRLPQDPYPHLAACCGTAGLARSEPYQEQCSVSKRKDAPSMARQRKTTPTQEFMPTPSALLDVEGAAQWLSISRAKLFELMHEDDFPVIAITGKLIRFDPN